MSGEVSADLLPLAVSRRTDEAEGVTSLELRRTDGLPLPPWSPGAHIELHLPSGLVRHYSLCPPTGGVRDSPVWRIAVLLSRNGAGGSRHVHDRLVEGAWVTARGPFQRFPLEPSDRYLFIAGGIGITPILSMLGEADRRGARWELVYGGRSLSSMAFREELAARYPGRVRVVPEDECGRPDLDSLLGRPLPATLVYCCGPESLLEAVEERCASWPDDVLRFERFAPSAATQPANGEQFTVELKGRGTTITVPSGKSILEAVEEAGVEVSYSCREGVCGSCETSVIEGRVEHRDSVLTPEEQAADDTIMICVSRAASRRLVLDI
ncbi:PDR/VanB family oxidoreductase [Streptomyces sp. LP05-1]|uniref:PDR/VanB family oxidoreductase n=1 Tax=Streptomyces pyxinae TaxID=2970734 RepID=A0ABT2CIJ0_9ACTN|nr:PDR/VanB family oxidoreductase [Streptomyces sp. LP05-1]MCS0636917.1 PDR/VanB family oxidoreductase [Streptomyces sp. LP05-1]